MQGNHLFEYAVIRVVPRVEREEFINVGVIVYCRERRFLRAMITVDEQKLTAFCSLLDVSDLKAHLVALEHICTGSKEGGPIAALEVATRFRWLTALRSTIVQTSRVHPGFCTDLQEAVIKLHAQLVL